MLVQQSSASSGKAAQPLILTVFLYLFLGDLRELKMPPSCQKGPGKHLSPRGHEVFYYFFRARWWDEKVGESWWLQTCSLG